MFFMKTSKIILKINGLLFKNKNLVFYKENIKYRTYNSLEIFNRFFKKNLKIGEDMKIFDFIDNLIIFSKEQIDYYKNQINTKINK